jgi:hypothetical protein
MAIRVIATPPAFEKRNQELLRFAQIRTAA